MSLLYNVKNKKTSPSRFRSIGKAAAETKGNCRCVISETKNRRKTLIIYILPAEAVSLEKVEKREEKKKKSHPASIAVDRKSSSTLQMIIIMYLKFGRRPPTAPHDSCHLTMLMSSSSEWTLLCVPFVTSTDFQWRAIIITPKDDGSNSFSYSFSIR